MVRYYFMGIGILMACMVLGKSQQQESPSSAPSPSVDCMSIIYDMTDCVTFISDGSTAEKPTSVCCSGFKTVLETDPTCICVSLKSSAQLGVTVNLTRAAALPSACNVPAPPITQCGVSLPPGTPPANPPSSSSPSPPPPSDDGAPSPNLPVPGPPIVPAAGPSNSPAGAPPTDGEEGGAKQAQAPAMSSGTYAHLPISSFHVIIITMLLASFSYISG